MPEILLKVENLTLATDQGIIVDQLSFQISAGEIVALTGRSGSGKTSIALAILHLLPTGIQMKSGLISWTGDLAAPMRLPEDQFNWASLRGSQIGFTQQDVFGAFDPVMKIGRQVVMVIRERIERKGIDLDKELRLRMEEVGLHDLDRLLASYPHQLSGGQLQRCQIAMALVIQPKLLISDEPTSAIDKINQRELLDVFSMLRNKYNMAILCITHEEAVVRQLADREIQLDDITKPDTIKGFAPQNEKAFNGSAVLEVKGIAYLHSYGGMMYKKGAKIGPLDFRLIPGTCLGIVGESGSGKSTLAQLLVGLYVPAQGSITLGEIEIDFANPDHMRQLRAKVQLVMQDGRGSLHPYISIRELFEDVRLVLGISESSFTVQVAQILAEVGLPEAVLDRMSGQLSGGECLRVSFARALLMQPEVVICDESTSALDGSTRDDIISLLSNLMQNRNLALVFISHDDHIIKRLAHRILVMADGKVVEQGLASDVIGYPTHAVTKKIFSTHATSGGR